MGKETIIFETEKRLPSDILYGTLYYKGNTYVMKDFMENVVPETLNPTATSVSLTSFINQNIVPYVAKNERAAALDNFFRSVPDFQEEVKIGPNDVLNVKDYFFENIMPFIDSPNTAIYCGKQKSLESIYETILNNTYTEPTLVDFSEICSSFCDSIDNDILASLYEGTTLEDYIKNVLPLLMVSVSKVEINGNEYEIDEYVSQIVKSQQEKNSYQTEAIDRTNENPGLVAEINLAMDEIKEQENSEDYSEQEREALINHNEKIKNNILSISSRITIIGDAIDNCTSESMLNSLENELVELEPLASNDDKTYITILKYRIGEKMRSIIKTNNNREDLINSSMRYVETLKTKINAASTRKEASTVFGLITVLSNKIQSLGFDDRSLSNEIIKLKELYKYKMQLIRENEMTLANTDTQVSKLDDEFEIIRRTMDFLDETDDVFYNSVLTSINYKLEDLHGAIVDAKNNKLLSNFNIERYEAMMADIINELDKKNKSGIVR